MKRDTLYTANPYNQKMFLSDREDIVVEDKKPIEKTKKKHEDELRTVNRFNIISFQPEKKENLFDGVFGSSQMNVAGSAGDLAKWDRLASDAYGANYGEQGFTMNDYMNSKNSLGISKKNNPFSKGNIGGTMQGLAGAGMNLMDTIETGDKRGMWDTLDPVYHLAGGRESGAGNAMSDAGVALTKSGLQSGQPYMALAGAALKVIGGLTNAAFGIKENKARKKAADASIDANRNFVSNAQSFDAIQGPNASTSTDIYEGGWFSGGKAADKNAEMARKMAQAYSWADRSVINNVGNLASNQIEDFMRNYSAFGGYLTRPKRKRKIKR